MTSGLHGHMQGPVSRLPGHSLQCLPLMGSVSKYCRLLHGEAEKQTFSQHAESHFQAETILLAVNEFPCIYSCNHFLQRVHVYCVCEILTALIVKQKNESTFGTAPSCFLIVYSLTPMHAAPIPNNTHLPLIYSSDYIVAFAFSKMP